MKESIIEKKLKILGYELIAELDSGYIVVRNDKYEYFVISKTERMTISEAVDSLIGKVSKRDSKILITCNMIQTIPEILEQ